MSEIKSNIRAKAQSVCKLTNPGLKAGVSERNSLVDFSPHAIIGRYYFLYYLFQLVSYENNYICLC